MNLILKDGEWRQSGEKLQPYVGNTVTYDKKEYPVYTGNVGLCKEGLIYSGIPVEGLGDTFIYDVDKDKYQPMNYGYIQNLSGKETITGIAVGDTWYGFDGKGRVYKIGIHSGLVKASAGSTPGGQIENANRMVMPGTTVTLTAKPEKGYRVKTFQVGNELVEGTTKKITLNSDVSVTATFEKEALTPVKVTGITITGTSQKIAAGKKVKLQAAVTPANAANQAVVWTSSNKKVATVDSKGVVTVKKGSGGKKVTITATAADGSGVKASYKITSMKGAVKKIRITGAKSVKAGKSLKIKARVTASKGADKTLTWKSSHTQYATVSSSGKVKTYKAGKGKKVKITAMATDGSKKKKTVTIKIK